MKHFYILLFIISIAQANPTLNLKIGGANAKNMLMQNADDVADGITNHSAKGKYLMRNQLYRHVMLRDIDPAVSPNINGFINSHKNKSIGRFWAIDSLINTGDTSLWSLANNINNNITISNDIEQTQQAFNSTYLGYLKNKRSVSSLNIADLEKMAMLCPGDYGDAVIQARTLLFNITHKQYINACEITIPSVSPKKLTNTTTLVSNIVFYPNPNDGKFVFESNDELTYELEVYNMLGEKIVQQTVNNRQEVNLQNMPSSTYLVRVIRNGETIKTTRLSIIK